jgi:hypothetical protein
VSRFSSKARRFGATLVVAAIGGGLASCELATVNVPKTYAGVVVHAVLNPNATTQVVLLERTLSGAANLPDTSFDSNDPIVSGGGIPISGATVEIIDSLGKAVRGVEDRTVLAEGKGAGVYRVPISGAALVLGARYRLHVRTTTGEDVTAATRIPRPDVRSSGGLTRTLNRDHDVLATQWAPIATARSYAVRIESPFGPFFLFTDTARVRLTGDLRNLFADDLQHVFIPGFRQDIVIGAVDSNFYDYYRTNNDPFTGSGIINRISGGIGLFGSFVTLNSGTLTVIADRSEPVEGRYRFAPLLSSATAPLTIDMTLYLESKAARSDLPNALSGRYTTAANGRVDGVIGEQLDEQITLFFLNNQLSGNHLDAFHGVLHGDTLTGTFQKGGSNGVAVFLRTP